MRYIINERQYKLLSKGVLFKEQQEILKLPTINIFGGWEGLHEYLMKKGYPLFSIEGDLDLTYSEIESLGNLVSVGGSLYLDGCWMLYSLENLTSVGGDLYLEGSGVGSLGNLTSVGGSLFLTGTNIESLGNLTSVGDDLFLGETPISKKYSEEEIRQMVKVGGKIYL